MAGSARVPVRRTRVVGAVRTRLFVLLAVLTGLVTMHQLAGAVPRHEHEHRHAADHAASSAGPATAGPATAGPTVVAAHRAERPVPSVGAIVDPSHGSPPCPPGEGHCPDRPHGHPGQVCQLSSPGSGPAVPTPVLAALPGDSPADPSRLQPGAARLSAAGTGCGPPSRAQLAVWRI